MLATIGSEAQARKIGLLFNGGGMVLEGPKHKMMIEETKASATLLSQKGYDLKQNVFVGSGPTESLLTAPPRPLPQGVSAAPAAVAPFMARVRAVCAEAQKGDDVFIGFSGHGEMGISPSDNSFVGQLDMKVKDPSAATKLPPRKRTLYESPLVRSNLKTYLNLVRVSTEIQALISPLPPGVPPTDLNILKEYNDRLNKNQNEMEIVANKVASHFGILRSQTTRVLNNLPMVFSANNPGEVDAAAEKAAFLLAQVEDQKAPGDPKAFGKNFTPVESLKVKELGEAIDECKKKGVRVRLSGTNCYSGGLLELTDSDQNVCATAIINAYHTSHYIPGQQFTASAGSLFEIKENYNQHMKREQENVAEIDDPRKKRQAGDLWNVRSQNLEPVDSSEKVIDDWISIARKACGEEVPSDKCIKPEAFSLGMCKAINGENAPPYFNLGSLTWSAAAQVSPVSTAECIGNLLEFLNKPGCSEQIGAGVTHNDAFKYEKLLSDIKKKEVADAPPVQETEDKGISTQAKLLKATRDFFSQFGLDAYDIRLQNAQEQRVQVERFLDQMKGDPKAKENFKQAFDVFMATAFKDYGGPPPPYKAIQSVLNDPSGSGIDKIRAPISDILIKSRMSKDGIIREQNPMEDSIRKEAYTELFKRFSQGECKKNYDKTLACVKAEL